MAGRKRASVTGLALQTAVVYLPGLQRAFATVALGAGDRLLCAGVASTVVFAREAGKACWRRADRRKLVSPA